MVCLISRTGRHLQRYSGGQRLVVGCIPYRFKNGKQPSSEDFVEGYQELEVLLISSQKGHKMLFPKGGWEMDESIEAAALREAVEEAGVVGDVKCKLGIWSFMSKRYATLYEGHMFSLLVKEELDLWPEKDVRQRKWLTVAEASKACEYLWMKEALDEFVRRLSTTISQLPEVEEKEEERPCSLSLENILTCT